MINIAINSTKDEIEKRLSNPFWWSFIISWIIVNWKIWYVTFFINETLILGNKIDYILSLYIPEWLAIFKLLILPLVMSAISIYIIPFISDEYLKQQKKNKEAEAQILINDIKKETKLENQKITQLEKLVKGKEKSSKLIQKTQELSGNSEWNTEHDLLIQKYPEILKELSLFIYTHKWYRSYYGNINALEIFDVYKLVEKLTWTYNGDETYQLTEKWRFFLKK